ncbi:MULTISPECIES: hypothetical protein [Holzapfeliella]
MLQHKIQLNTLTQVFTVSDAKGNHADGATIEEAVEKLNHTLSA